jgi:hypothetical protein
MNRITFSYHSNRTIGGLKRNDEYSLFITSTMFRYKNLQSSYINYGQVIRLCLLPNWDGLNLF